MNPDDIPPADSANSFNSVLSTSERQSLGHVVEITETQVVSRYNLLRPVIKRVFFIHQNYTVECKYKTTGLFFGLEFILRVSASCPCTCYFNSF